MIRLPKYLDEDLVRTLADYLDLETAESREVRNRTTSQGQGSLGMRAGIAQAQAGRESGRETEETFSAPIRPIRVFNDVIDALVRSGELIELDRDPAAGLIHRSPVEVSGIIKVSPVSEVAAAFAMLTPLLMSGANMDDIDPSQIAGAFIEQRSAQAPVVVELQPHDGDYTFAAVLKPGLLGPSVSFDELEGEFTVFGTLDRVMGQGDSLNLEQFMFPGWNRTLRRAIGRDDLEGMLVQLGGLTSSGFEPGDLHFEGPGALIGAMAIYP